MPLSRFLPRCASMTGATANLAQWAILYRTYLIQFSQPRMEIPMKRFTLSLASLLLASLFLLAGCNSLPVIDGPKEDIDAIRKQLLGEMPLPLGARIDNEASLILGSGENWTGRVVLNIPLGAAEVFNSIREQFQAGGWTLLSSVKSKNSILVLTRLERTVTLEISEGASLSGSSRVILSVAPRNNALPAPRRPDSNHRP